ncbi:MAG TPA: hypothetical protein VFC09_15340 [Candidatus Dormibacteraeota bacterium]|nr:hypothetical protein [Candidatus Dormibacteraeota bacterium]
MLTTRHDLGLPEKASEREMEDSHLLLSVPMCPHVRRGAGSAAMLRCPGFRPAALSFAGVGAGEALGEQVTCEHLGTQRGARGFVSACRHPGGPPAA